MRVQTLGNCASSSRLFIYNILLNIVKPGLSPQTGSAQLTNQTEDLGILVTHIEVPANDQRPFPQNCKTLAGPDSHLKFKYTLQIKV